MAVLLKYREGAKYSYIYRKQKEFGEHLQGE